MVYQSGFLAFGLGSSGEALSASFMHLLMVYDRDYDDGDERAVQFACKGIVNCS